MNSAVVCAARQQGIFCLSVDQSTQGDFTLPAVLRRGPLTVAVATDGGSPALARQLRDQLAGQVSDHWGVGVEIIAAVRRKWLTERLPGQYNHQLLHSFWEEQLIPALEDNDVERVDQLLRENFGANFSLAQLQIQLPEGMP